MLILRQVYWTFCRSCWCAYTRLSHTHKAIQHTRKLIQHMHTRKLIQHTHTSADTTHTHVILYNIHTRKLRAHACVFWCVCVRVLL
jgi:hypothetical protein